MSSSHLGDSGAQVDFTSAYAQHHAGLRRYVVSIIIDQHLAEDVVHETFLELWRHPDHFDPSRADLRSWLRTIAHGRAVDRIRSSEAARNRDVRFGTRDHDSVDDRSDRRDTVFGRPGLRAALDGLTEKQRDAVVLRYLGERSTPEVAALLGVTVGTAKTRVRDGLLALRVQLESERTAA